MYRKAWILILLVILFMGFSLLGIQFHLLNGLEKSLTRVFHRDSQLEYESFAYDFLSSKANFKNVKILKGSEYLKIDELELYFKHGDFSKMDFVIERVFFSNLKIHVNKTAKINLGRFLSHEPLKFKSSDKFRVKEVTIREVSLKIENFMRANTSEITSILLKNFDVPLVQFNGSMDFSASVLYFSLRTAIQRIESEFDSRLQQMLKSSRKK